MKGKSCAAIPRHLILLRYCLIPAHKLLWHSFQSMLSIMVSIQKRIGLVLIILSFLGCYLEWGQNQHTFVYQVAIDLFRKGFDNKDSFTHPLILLPFAGLLVLIYGLFARQFSKKLFLIGAGMIGLLVFFVLLSGVLSGNLKMLIAPVVFFGSVVGVLRSK